MFSLALHFFKDLHLSSFRPKYLHGIPNFNSPARVVFEPQIDGVALLNADADEKMFLRLKRTDIINISVEDQTTIEKRVGFKRLLLVGIFALAWKKKDINPLSFLIIEYKDRAGLIQEVYIQSDKKNGYQTFNNIKYNLYRFWKDVDENPNLIEQLKKVKLENKAIQKQREEKVNNGCLTFIIVAVLFFIILILAK